MEECSILTQTICRREVTKASGNPEAQESPTRISKNLLETIKRRTVKDTNTTKIDRGKSKWQRY
jgi:hypothetical protein